MKRRMLAILIIIIIIGVLAGLLSGMGIWTDYMWFASLGYQSTFWTLFLNRFGIGLAAFILSLLFFWFNFWYARRCLPRQRTYPEHTHVIEVGEDFIRRFYTSTIGTRLLLGFCILLALLLAAQASSQWEIVQKLIHATPFGQTDPIFGLDVGFYIFKLPFYELLHSLLTIAFILVLVFVGLVYFFLATNEFLGGRWQVFSPVKLHLALLTTGLLMTKAWGYHLSTYGLLLSRGGTFFGAGYTDVHARLPALNILMVLALAAAVIVFIETLRGHLRPIAISLGVLVGASAVIGGIYPVLVQKFQVEPNEFSREQPYLEYNVAATRYAYDLEKVRHTESLLKSGAANQLVLEKYRSTLANLRLWDYRPLGQVYSQMQQLRRYYRFVDVDIDRYKIGKDYRQVMLSVRELDQNNLPERARTWVNRRLQYTHGYGVVISPVNEVNPRGLPVFLVQDIPPKTSAMKLEINRPQIYFGELTTNMVVVNTKAGEFDHPSGQKNVYTNYEGEGGIQLSNWWRRLAYAIRFQDLRLFLNTDITPESRILYYRTVQDTCRLAPYLEYDSDPYPVIANGRIYWIWDAYTITNHYPYSEPNEQLNYIRNAVKVVVDAYQGNIAFYISDSTDPIIHTYSKIFPDLYRPLKEMPVELRSHIRYPVDFLEKQVSVYTAYHMQDTRVFYNREDEWSVPFEKYAGNSQQMEPYYAIVQLPGEAEAEFVLVLPFTPIKRENLVAWMAARCDGENYGELVVYEFPKDSHVFGPMQVEASIDQDAEISQQLTLWSQHGSEVIRGNLTTVPLAGNLLYVEPLFLQAEESSLPELTRVIVFYEDQVVMAKDLETALNQLPALQEALLSEPPELQQQQQSPAPLPEGMVSLVRRASELYKEAQERLRSGNWTGYGEAIDALGEVLDRMVDQAKNQKSELP